MRRKIKIGRIHFYEVKEDGEGFVCSEEQVLEFFMKKALSDNDVRKILKKAGITDAVKIRLEVIEEMRYMEDDFFLKNSCKLSDVLKGEK